MKDEIIASTKVDAKNRITIPKEVREIFDIKEGDYVFWKRRGDYVIFGKVEMLIKEKPIK